MGLQRSISNLSKASFSTYFYVFDSLQCDWREALFGHNDYYLFAQHKSDTYCSLCIQIFLSCSFFTFFSCVYSVYCSRSAAWIHICFSLFTYYCIIDGDALYVALERTCKRNNDFFFSACCFCLFASAVKSSTFGAFLICVSEIIQQYKLLTSFLLCHTLCILPLPWDQHSPLWAKHAK